MPKKSEPVAPVTSARSSSPTCRPPVHPSSLGEWVNDSVNQENVKGEAANRFHPESMRGVDSLFYRPPVQQMKTPPRGGPLGEVNADPLGELEAILTYVEHVTVSLTRRERVSPPPESLRTLHGSLVTFRRAVNTSDRESTTRRALAAELHDQAATLLAWIARLEYVSISQSISLRELEKEVGASAANIDAVLDAIEVRYRNHDVADVQEFFMGSRETLKSCRSAVSDLVGGARKVLVLRRAVASREAVRVKELFGEYWGNKGGGGTVRIVCPFVDWVEKSWFPAIEKWEAIVSGAKKEAELGDVKGAFARAQRLALTESSMIGKIIQPGETLSELLHQYLEEPLAAVEQSLKRRKSRMEALRVAMTTKDGKRLAECLCAVEELRAGKELSAEDTELAEKARKQIVHLQQVGNITMALRLAVQAGETVTLFRTIHQANELLLQLGIVGNPEAGEETVQRCNTLLREMQNLPSGVSLTDFVVKRVNPMKMNLAHVPSHVWTSETTAAYQAAWQRLATRAMQGLCRFQHESDPESDSGTAHGLHTRSNSGLSCGSHSVRGGGNAIAAFTRTRTQQTEVGNPQNEWSHVQFGSWVEPAASERALAGRARSSDVDGFKLKIHFEAQLRVLRIQGTETCTFDEVYKRVHDLCTQQTALHHRPAGQKLRLRYEDAEGDCISLLTQEDWNVFISEQAPSGLRGAKLEIYCDFPPVPSQSTLDRTPLSTTSKDGGSSPTVKNTPQTTTSARLATGGTQMKPLLESDQAKGAKPSRCQSAGIAHRRGNGVSRLVSNRRVSHDDFHVPKQTPKTPAGMGTSADGGKDALEIGVPRDFDAAVHEREVPKRIGAAPSVSYTQPRAFPVKQTTSSGNAMRVSPKVGRPLGTAAEAKKLRTPPKLVGGDVKNAVRGAGLAGNLAVEEPVEAIEAKKWKDDETGMESDVVTSTISQARTPISQRKAPSRVVSAMKQTVPRSAVTGHHVNSRVRNAPVGGIPCDAAVVEEKREWSVYHFRPSEIHPVANDREETPPSVGSRVKGALVTERLSGSSSTSIPNSTTTLNGGAKKAEALIRYRQLREEKQRALKAAVQKRISK
ncbi:hypothetical protein, conserved [Trypanosoma brucei brucei TREU927]|uniref:PB1 domain-containing protein n=1 Tax=Trypanosoma brucei brucei (strain 927/4 GUTat10.1) TaxID=185431 RepID=Q38CG8_TRYB2|nr:hypothetical protein, conserved [Trypanosoma brucei brucei TREU927]EAN77502.1 hypothetical protein, conserved [Trypanosoma brucei brucei TREU927]